MKKNLKNSLVASIATLACAIGVQAQTVVEYNNQGDFPNSPNGQFFYSADPTEQNYVDSGAAGQFKRTGMRFGVGGPTPVCRFYGSVTPGPNSHFYTVDQAECNSLKAAQITPRPTTTQQWNYEGNGFNTIESLASTNGAVCPTGSVPVYRAYNRAFDNGAKNTWDSNHRYSTHRPDIEFVVNKSNWRDEGIVFCAAQALPEAGIVARSSVAASCGSMDAKKSWVRAHIDENYLWYGEVPRLAKDVYADSEDYFLDLKTWAKTASGKDKDEFHYVISKADWDAFQNSDAGIGYGWDLALLSPGAPRRAIVRYTEPGSPAASAGVQRGWELQMIDSIDFVNGNDPAQINAILFPQTAGGSHAFTFRDQAGGLHSVTLSATQIRAVPVNIVKTLSTPTGNVGYIFFNDFAYAAEGQLVNAVNQLRSANVRDLVLDLRYNGGGLLYIASQLGYMIAGNVSNDKTFEKLLFNDKRVADNNDPDNDTPFFNVTSGFTNTGTTANRALPTLSLNRLYVIATDETASASESVINSLRGIGVEVVLIGDTTVGKPYGFLPAENCDTVHLAVEFKGLNNAGFGDFADGFAPTCRMPSDDYAHALGDSAESRLAAALQYRATGTCPTPVTSVDGAKRAIRARADWQRVPGKILTPNVVRKLTDAMQSNRSQQ